MARRISLATAFNPTLATVDATGISGLNPQTVLAIFDTTAPQRPTLYDFTTPGLGFAGVSGLVMTVEFDTTGLSSEDTILIVWDDGSSSADAGRRHAGGRGVERQRQFQPDRGGESDL
jgi:hypothetical protein